MNILKNNLAFSLIEVLLMVTLFAIVLSSAISIVGNKTSQEDLSAKARQVVDFVSRAHDYSVSGFQQDVWGIKILDNDALCEDNGDCLVLFKSRDWNSRDSSYDRFLNFNTGVYIDADQENEFYFEYMSGWLSTNYDQAITLKHPGINENKVIVTETSGLTYIQGQQQFGESLVMNQSAQFSMGTFSDTEVSGDTLKLSSVISEGYNLSAQQMAYDSYTNSLWVTNASTDKVYKVNQSNRIVGSYSITGDINSYSEAVFDSATNSIWVTSDSATTGYITQIDVVDGTILQILELDDDPQGVVFDTFTNSIWARRYDFSSNSLFKINVNTATTSEYGIAYSGYAGAGIAFDSENNTVWLGNQDDLYEYSVIDGSLQNSYLGYVSDGICQIYDILFESFTGSIWFADTCNDIVYKIDNSDGSVLASTTISNLHDIAYDSTDNQIFAINRSGTLSKLNINTGVVESTSDTPYTASTISTEILYNSLDDTIIWAVGTANTLVHYDTDSTNTFTNYFFYDVCDAPEGIAYDSSRDNIWVACNNAGVIHSIDPDSGLVLSTTTLSYASEIIYDSVNDFIWALGSIGTTLIKIDPVSANIDTLINLTSISRVLTYDSFTNSIWVGISDGTVDKIDIDTQTNVGNYYAGGGTDINGIGFDNYTNSIWTVSDNRVYTKIDVSDGSFLASSTLTSVTQPLFALHNLYNNNILAGASSIDVIDSTSATILSTPASLNSICDLCKNGVYDPINNSIWLADYTSVDGGVSHVNASDYSSIGEYNLGDYVYDIVYDSNSLSIWGTLPYQDKIVKLPVRGYSSSGNYISQILDTFSNTEFGTISWTATSPAGTSLAMKVRTATSSDMSGAIDWDSCDAVSNGIDISSNNCVTDTERYVQYRAYFTTSNDGSSPALDTVTILYNNN